MKRSEQKGFTIIELLVVVSIIALLIGILLPAIGKARDQAKLTQSKTNLRNLGTAHATYASEWNDRQITFVDDNISRYGASSSDAYPEYEAQNGVMHPPMVLGYEVGGEGGFWKYPMDHPGNWGINEPIGFPGIAQSHFVGFGSFRMANCKQFNQYVSGKFYDPIFYAPKDKAAWTAIEECLDNPGEFCNAGGPEDCYWTSYCLSPAAMFSPDVMRNERDGGWQSPWVLKAGFRSPSMSQAQYAQLKTHMVEHHWLQGARAECNPAWADGTFNGCEPYYFNASRDSTPMSLFYDGHIEPMGVQEAMKSSARNYAQTQEQSGTGFHLWHRFTPFEGTDPADAGGGWPEGGYFMDMIYDGGSSYDAITSFHILTTDGILGRDKTGG